LSVEFVDPTKATARSPRRSGEIRLPADGGQLFDTNTFYYLTLDGGAAR
jgi:hypothetical protein